MVVVGRTCGEVVDGERDHVHFAVVAGLGLLYDLVMVVCMYQQPENLPLPCPVVSFNYFMSALLRLRSLSQS